MRERAAVAALLLALAVQLAWAIRADGLTSDEVLYIAAGWAQVKAGDLSVNAE